MGYENDAEDVNKNRERLVGYDPGLSSWPSVFLGRFEEFE